MNARPGSYVEPKKLTQCKRCGAGNLVWWQGKSGRFYLAQTQQSQSEYRDTRYACPWAPHNCERFIARMNEWLHGQARTGAAKEAGDIIVAHDTHAEFNPKCANCQAARGNWDFLPAFIDQRTAERFTPWEELGAERRGEAPATAP